MVAKFSGGEANELPKGSVGWEWPKFAMSIISAMKIDILERVFLILVLVRFSLSEKLCLHEEKSTTFRDTNAIALIMYN